MTDFSIPTEQLSPHFECDNLEVNTQVQWANLLPVAKASFDYFASQNFVQPFLVCQAPSFLQQKSIISALTANLPETKPATYTMLFDPNQPTQPLFFELKEDCLLQFDTAMSKLAATISNDKLSVELLANEFIDDEALLNAAHVQNFNAMLEQIILYQKDPGLSDAVHNLCQYLAADTSQSKVCIAKYYKAWQGCPGLNVCQDFSRTSLFGSLLPFSKQGFDFASIKLGLLHHSVGSILMLSCEDVLADPQLWFDLKASINTQHLSWSKATSTKQATMPNPMPYQQKVIFVGNGNAVADLYELDPDIVQMSLIETELPHEVVANKENLGYYLGQLHCLSTQQALGFGPSLYHSVLKLATKFCEHNQLLSLDFNAVLKPLRLLAHLGLNSDSAGFNQACYALEQNINAHQKFSDLAYKDKQTKIEVSGKQVGQINGLSVIDFSGLGLSFGEPIRITASAHQGDGDFTDVERKAELAGNIHAKSMMIIQGYLTSLFARDHHFPLSGSIVFEQSYQDIDGDSASLASTLCMLSALSNEPLHQHIAVTGAMDQKGNVLAVGGINEKIEGFYRIATLDGNTEKHAVLLPKANVSQLNLSEQVIQACEKGLFTVYGVEHIDQAIEIMFGLKAGSLFEEQTVYGKINKLVGANEAEPSALTWLLKKLFG
ncbi:AAA family ATPase [Agarivorans sp. MS3-6]